MTNERSSSLDPMGHGPLGAGDPCPDPEMLSAYLDGKLDETLKRPIEDHISRCEDCYFVVREAAESSVDWPTPNLPAVDSSVVPSPPAQTPAVGMGPSSSHPARSQTDVPSESNSQQPTPPTTAPSASKSKPSARSGVSYSVLLAAMLAASAGAVVIWNQAQRAKDPRAALVEAVGERRFFDARLTGGFRFGVRIHAKRGGSSGGMPDSTTMPSGRPNDATAPARRETGPADEDWSILAAAARLETDVGPTGQDNRSAAYLVLGKADQAVRLLEQTLDGVDRRKDPATAARTLSNLSAAYLARADGDGREDDYPRALESAAHAVELDPSLVEALYNKALALERLHLRNRALEAWDAYIAVEIDAGWKSDAIERRRAIAARPVAQALRDKQDVLDALSNDNLGQLDRAVRNNVGVARDVFEKELLLDHPGNDRRRAVLASAFLEATGDHSLVSALQPPMNVGRTAAFSRARLAYDSGDWTASRRDFQRVLSLDQQRGDSLNLWSRFYLAVLDFQKNMPGSVPELTKVRRDSEELYPILAARANWVLALAASGEGDYSTAIAQARAALEGFERVGYSEYAGFMHNQLAEVYEALGDEVTAWECRRASLSAVGQLREELRRGALYSSASAQATRAGHGRVGLEILAEAETALDRSSQSFNSNLLSLRRARGRTREAIEPGKGSLELAGAEDILSSISDPVVRERSRGELLATRADLSVESNDALDVFTPALAWLKTRGAFDRLPAILLGRGRLRSRAGRSDLANADFEEGLRIFERPTTVADDLRLSHLDKAWRLYEETIDAALARDAVRDAMAIALRAMDRSFRLGGSRRKERIDELVALPPDQGTLVVFEGARTVTAWFVRAGEIRVFRSSAEVLPQLVGSLRRSVVAGDVGQIRQEGSRIAESLLGPDISSRLSGTSRLAVVPHGDLTQIPWSCLALPTGRLLLESMTLSIAPTVDLALGLPRRMPRGGLLVIADPSTQRLPRLPAARREAAATAALYDGTQTLMGDQASLTAVRQALKAAASVHLAAHGVHNRLYPTRSGVVLADGELSGEWVAQQDLRNIKVAVLGACRSANGDDGSPLRSGSWGMARPFLLAGVGAVVGSLFDLDDDAAADVLGDLHRRLSRGENPSDALSHVQRESLVQMSSRKRSAALSLSVFSPIHI